MSVSEFVPVFIGGCPRSGTTFLGDRLGALLGARVTPESQFKRGVLAALADGDTARAVQVLDSHRVYRLWTERPAREDLLACTTAQSFFAKLVFPDGVPSDRAPFWVDHTPINFDDFVALRATFPQARFVNLIRDGRAVYSSVRGLDWGPTSPIQAAHWWAARVAPGLGASLTFPANCTTCRYEELTGSDPAAWTRLVRFVTNDAERSVNAEELSAKSVFNLPDYTKHQHTLVGSPPIAARAEAWRTALTPREIELFEAYAGGLLDTLGYCRAYRFPHFASRGEMIRMGEWPVRITARLASRLRNANRWRKVKAPQTETRS